MKALKDFLSLLRITVKDIGNIGLLLFMIFGIFLNYKYFYGNGKLLYVAIEADHVFFYYAFTVFIIFTMFLRIAWFKRKLYT